ncbi:hypothetical protein A4I49_004502 [Salmonella enterica subsp. enterica serovar Choleraesuis]|nr:hypothetical protein [Salmonella enterica]EDQ7331017.1 hypothetical protein [Salmonella enterica subsp. enterica serovar Paratyphi C]EDV0589509.1 hypothetical protein [Salmonella enterica subsp. enterica serovar Gateshead]EEJ2325089.1 hypothetical protein [Salmonella enterica subsp. enterica serovar Choleraesuis]HAB5172841.1 hypothetical protein [Salmonella enterica subsp. enterica]
MTFSLCFIYNLITGYFLTCSFPGHYKNRRSGLNVGALRIPDTLEVAGISPRRVSYSSDS